MSNTIMYYSNLHDISLIMFVIFFAINLYTVRCALLKEICLLITHNTVTVLGPFIILMIYCHNPKPRAPEANQRPHFRDILLLILENEEVVLDIPQDVISCDPQAVTLGASLHLGLNLYKDIQNCYFTNN